MIKNLLNKDIRKLNSEELIYLDELLNKELKNKCTNDQYNALLRMQTQSNNSLMYNTLKKKFIYNAKEYIQKNNKIDIFYIGSGIDIELPLILGAGLITMNDLAFRDERKVKILNDKIESYNKHGKYSIKFDHGDGRTISNILIDTSDSTVIEKINSDLIIEFCGPLGNILYNQDIIRNMNHDSHILFSSISAQIRYQGLLNKKYTKLEINKNEENNLLKYNLIPVDIMRGEISFYKKKANLDFNKILSEIIENTPAGI